MPFVIGLTGGIASGKTTVANIFQQQFGIDVIDADIKAREVVAPNSEGLKAIETHFGSNAIIAETKQLNRAYLREVIFSSREEKQWLDNLLHPMIKEKILSDLNNTTSPYCLIVIPLLVENAWQSLCNRVLVVDVNEETQIERTIKRDNVSRKQAENALSAQASRQNRLSIADDIIENNSNSEQLLPKVAQLHQKYLAIVQKNR
ncbi:dephospho-CoA kinase [Vibrio sp.]|uniref:Dephospho-CoA kinase n=1 Tax=Vibrio viridaestus TaxID=2487322 RepID=A0A3N9THP0_9VIBR|nr:dephospho-CoA kinase [Vibrio viridaestus]MDC0610682.1 dephospho-CoA kinase [Vibrio sp.]RQW63808.1 dephospho-CoA kinase [Vibrio viridaestus]